VHTVAVDGFFFFTHYLMNSYLSCHSFIIIKEALKQNIFISTDNFDPLLYLSSHLPDWPDFSLDLQYIERILVYDHSRR
jgi:hypothetical protein